MKTSSEYLATLTPTDRKLALKLIKELKKHISINSAMAEKVIKKSPRSTLRFLNKLAQLGIITKTGANKNRLYFLSVDIDVQ